MNNSRSLLCVCFCAGLLGALANSSVTWLAAKLGLPQWCGVDLVPQWTAAWIYPRLLWGGLWGLVFFMTVGSPRSRTQWVRKGLWVSVLLSAWQLFYIYPNRTAFGVLGLGLGTLTPLFILFYNLIWGGFTGFFARAFWGRNR
ncbi:hypothetical protein Pcar_2432 [Syntrophotalea carbinolica DSM 2380]|uniref:Uncharacterized protein n=1 Tax=Syntrophotalea carbinolica (strain DSM 2380 / NBRC 103641 / GraBd1) TaxID=338963 RepID=Q3A1T6_SYNC1|nr:hypothetical protein [Syntrophotalea carbinolica]ABA89671.1 hypothetical protein Pcar_2432 [Syntrophotalea carbinolica DSM 2380]